MADVPFATNLLGAIAPLIAQAPGATAIGNAIGNLPDAYWAGQNQAYQQRNRNLFQNGVPTNIQDLATMLLKSRGAEGVPEAVSLGNLGVIQGIANQSPPAFNPNVGNSGYTTPGPQTSAEPPQAEPAPSPTAGTATLRQIAQARSVPVEQILAAGGGGDPDAPLNFDQRKAVVAKLGGADTAAPTPAPQSFAGRFPGITTSPTGASGITAPPRLPPSIGAPSPPAPPVQAQPAQVAQAQLQAPQGPGDPAAQQLEMTAARADYAAQVLRQRAAAASATGTPAGKALSESLGAQAGAYEKQAENIHKSLLERGMPTQAAKDALNPAIRSGAALTGVDKIDAEAYAKNYGSFSDLARSATTQGLPRVEELKTLTTDPNFYSGPFYKGMQSYRQFQSYFGRDPTAATPMEAFNKGVKDILTEQIKGLSASGVGRVNLTEVRNMQGATATLENSPAGNRAQLEVLRRTYLQQQAIGQIAEGVNQEIASGRIPPGQFRARLNQVVDTYAQRNKMFTPIEQKNPILLGAVDAPADFTRQPLAQARAWGLQRNVHPGDPLHMPDGSYIKAP